MQIRHLTKAYIDRLVEMGNENREEFKKFTPHPFEKKYLLNRIKVAKKDLYYVVVYEEKVIGYGMLRGMDEGYSVPMLGIGIDKKYYGTGVASLLMNFLETTARIRGYKQMKLRVYKDNQRAYPFYKKLGYTYSPFDEHIDWGIKDL